MLLDTVICFCCTSAALQNLCIGFREGGLVVGRYHTDYQKSVILMGDSPH